MDWHGPLPKDDAWRRVTLAQGTVSAEALQPSSGRQPMLGAKGTGLRVSDFELQFRLFGAFKWRLRDADKQGLFLGARGTIGKRLEKLHEAGVTRGAFIDPSPTELRLVEKPKR